MGNHAGDHLAERPCPHPRALCRGMRLPSLMVWTDPLQNKQELNRIERELDANEPPGGKPPAKRGGGQGGEEQRGKSDNRSLDAVLVTALLLSLLPQHWCSQAGLAPHNGCN